MEDHERHLQKGRTFANRRDAGRRVAVALAQFKNIDDLVILALPRGGVPVAAEMTLLEEIRIRDATPTSRNLDGLSDTPF
jgi:hypothetical protein